ncbi:MAG TPA: hypothetical protein VEH06_01615 [Candidatus Bathyarchaeia archaeon]|nr:hypothetical protein [Candidatus Bathyarchaeia archaeon]
MDTPKNTKTAAERGSKTPSENKSNPKKSNQQYAACVNMKTERIAVNFLRFPHKFKVK